MAYSSYMELSYKQVLPYDLSLYGAVGMTPWKSGYTGYQGSFAVVNIDIRLRKDWSVSERCGMMLMGQLMITENPLKSPYGAPTLMRITLEELAKKFRH